MYNTHMPPRIRKSRKPTQLPLPPFNMTVDNIGDAPVSVDKVDVRRLIWINFTVEKAQELEDFLHKKIAEHQAGLIGVEIEGIVKS